MGVIEYRICEFLKKTPSEIGEIRRDRPLDIAFIERAMIHEYKEKEKAYKEASRKAKSKKGKGRRR